MGVRALLLAAFGLLALGGSAIAQTAAAPKTIVDVGGHKLNVRVSGTANPGVPTVVFESVALLSSDVEIVVKPRARTAGRRKCRSPEVWSTRCVDDGHRDHIVLFL